MKDEDILSINSPQARVGGPHAIVYKDDDDGWAIVAMDWDGDPVLGIRWFDFAGGPGHPSGHGNPTWFVIPSQLSKSILAGLPLEHKFSNKIDKFLADEISGENLAS